MKLLSIKRNVIMFLCLFVALACFATLFNYVPTAFADEVPTVRSTTFDPSTVEDKCAQLSATDDLEDGVDENGNPQTLEDYMTRMKNNPYPYTVQSDLTYRIIPQELFLNNCEYYHKGVGYSYYIHTTTDAMSEFKCSDVFIINTNFRVDLSINIADIELITYSGKYITDQTSELGLITYRCSDYSTDSSFKYDLHNIQFYVGLINEHALNKDDVGYSMQNDEGAVLIQTRLNYTELVRRESNSLIPLGKQIFNVFVGRVPFVGDSISTMIDIVDWLNTWDDCHVVDTEYIDHDNEDNICDFATKENQPTVYRDYIKFAFVSPQNNNVIASEHAQLIAKFSNTQNVTRIVMGAYYDVDIYDEYSEKEYLYFDNNKKCLAQTYYNSANRDDYKQFSTHYSQVILNKSYTAAEGDNRGYLAAADSEQVFEFIPNKNGKYIIDADSNRKITLYKNGTKQDSSEILNANTSDTYTISFKGNNATSIGVYDFSIRFVPDPILLGQTINQTVKQDETEYLAFTPTSDGVYRLSATGDNIRLFVARADSENDILAQAYGAIDMLLYGGVKYYIGMQNNGGADSDVALSVSDCTVIRQGETISETISGHRYYALDIPLNGEYTFDFAALNDLGVTLYNDCLGVINNAEGDFIEFSQFLTAGKYYLYLLSTLPNLQVQSEYNFTPERIVDSSTNLDHLDEGNTYSFVPAVSAAYSFSIANGFDADIQIFDEDMNEFDGQYFAKGTKYYLQIISEAYTSGLLKTEIITGGSFALNSVYTSAVGHNAVKYTAALGGSYILSGITEYTVTDTDFNACSLASLAEGETYYIIFDTAAAQEVSLYFNPPALAVGVSTALDYNGQSEVYRLLSVSSETVYSFRLELGKLKVHILDDDFDELLFIDDKNQSIITLSPGRYYVKVEFHLHTNDSLYVQGGNQKEATYNIGDAIMCYIEAGNCFTFLFTPNNTRLYELFTGLYGVDFNSTIIVDVFSPQKRVDSELVTRKNFTVLLCKLEADKMYKIKFTAIVDTKINFIIDINETELFVKLTVGSLVYSKGDKVGVNDYLVMGVEHNIVLDTLYDHIMPGSIGAKINNTSVPINNGKIIIAPDLAYNGKAIIITCSVNEGEIVYSIPLKLPYYAVASITGADYTITYKGADGKNAPNNPEVKSRRVYYKDASNREINVSTAKSGIVSLVQVPTVNSLEVGVTITFVFNGYEYSYKTSAMYNADNNIVKFVDLSGANSSVSGVKTVTHVTKVYNIGGAANNSFGLKIDKRTTPLYINLVDCNFSCSSAQAIYAMDTGTVYINAAGDCVIRSTAAKTNAIEIKNLVISGSSLSVYGGSATGNYSSITKGGDGIVSDSLTVLNAKLTVYGGDAKLNGCSMTGGDGIVATTLSVNNSTLKAYGGSGTYEAKKKGYGGAWGGDGISTSSISVVKSNVSFYGGAGGKGDYGVFGTKGTNGGHGTDGKVGGTGGYGGKAVNMIYDSNLTKFTKDGASVVAFTGGKGGDGGNGGNGGNGGAGVGGVNNGNGGNGGRGGNGGVYGSGGIACRYSFDGVQAIDGMTGIGGFGGYGGDGGNAVNNGKGGDGGNGGDAYFVNYRSNGGDAGKKASQKGSDGKVGRVGYCIPYGYVSSYYFKSTVNKYTFYSYTPATVTIYTTTSVGDPYLELYDQNGKLLASDDNGNGGVNARITHFIAPGNRWTIAVKSLKIQAPYVEFGIYVR